MDTADRSLQAELSRSEGSPRILEGSAAVIANSRWIRLRSRSEAAGCEILGKAEFQNPGGSVKDRAALNSLRTIGMPSIERDESALLAYATLRLKAVPGLTPVGTAAYKASLLSFVIAGIDLVAIGAALNQDGIAVRTGHHCTQPILRRFGCEATVRDSLAFRNACQEVDAFVRALHRLAGSSGARARGDGELSEHVRRRDRAIRNSAHEDAVMPDIGS